MEGTIHWRIEDIVHELVHLVHPNHTPKFWAEVENRAVEFECCYGVFWAQMGDDWQLRPISRYVTACYKC